MAGFEITYMLRLTDFFATDHLRLNAALYCRLQWLDNGTQFNFQTNKLSNTKYKPDSQGWILLFDDRLFTTFCSQHPVPSEILKNHSQHNWPLFDIRPQDISKYLNWAESIRTALENKQNAELQHTINQILLHTASNYVSYKALLPGQEQLGTYNKLKKLIDDMLHTRCALSHYADEMQMKPKELNEFCYRLTGKKLQGVIDEHRIIVAKYLLADTQEHINKIAEILAFSTGSSFAGFFIKHTRISPSQYRTWAYMNPRIREKIA